MMAIDVYWGSGSPYSWRVLLALEYKRLPYTSHVLQFSKQEHKSPQMLALNWRGKVPVLIDGGVRRGTDALKALALGATAVGIGRPYVWGLASFGEPGVDRVLEILDTEFITIMRQVGALNITQITRNNVTRA